MPKAASAATREASPEVEELAATELELKVNDIEPEHVDPVETSSFLAFLMEAAFLLSVYGTYYLAHDVLPPLSDEFGTLNYTLAAVPFFIALVFFEMFVIFCGAAPKSTAGGYESTETWSCFAAGTVQVMVVAVFRRFVPVALYYSQFYEKYALVKLPETWPVLLAAFVFCDFCYYWLHRHTHVYNFLWTGHALHHNGERYNLSNSATVLVASHAGPAVFWVHTCAVRRLWWPLELIFATPSHHRVHHDRRVHKNFGGVFIIWDRMFNTFQDELEHRKTKGGLKHQGDETCYFGIKEVMDSWTEPVLQVQLWGPVLRNGFTNFIVGPGWVTAFKHRPLPIVCPPEIKRLRTRTEQSWVGVLYLWLQYAVSLLVLVEVMGGGASMSNTALFVRCAFGAASLTLQGILLDGNRGGLALGLEAIKHSIFVLSLTTFAAHPLLSSLKAFGFYSSLCSGFLLLAYGRELLGRPVDSTKKGQ